MVKIEVKDSQWYRDLYKMPEKVHVKVYKQGHTLINGVWVNKENGTILDPFLGVVTDDEWNRFYGCSGYDEYNEDGRPV